MRKSLLRTLSMWDLVSIPCHLQFIPKEERKVRLSKSEKKAKNRNLRRNGG